MKLDNLDRNLQLLAQAIPRPSKRARCLHRLTKLPSNDPIRKVEERIDQKTGCSEQPCSSYMSYLSVP